MAAITDLAAAGGVNAADNLVINQSGTDRKVTADKFAVVSLTNTFSLLQTLTSGAAIGTSGNTLTRVAAGVVRQKVENTTLVATGDLAVQTGNNGRGLVLVYYANLGLVALFAVEGATGSIIWGNAANFGGTNASTNGKINVYAAANIIYVQNGTAGTVTLQVFVLL
jgi:hypothetical protein